MRRGCRAPSLAASSTSDLEELMASSGDPGTRAASSPSGRRWAPSLQGHPEGLQADAKRGTLAESLAAPCPSTPPDLSADAPQCSGSTDPGLTRSERPLPPTLAAIADDRLLTVDEICALLQVRKSIV